MQGWASWTGREVLEKMTDKVREGRVGQGRYLGTTAQVMAHNMYRQYKWATADLLYPQ